MDVIHRTFPQTARQPYSHHSTSTPVSSQHNALGTRETVMAFLDEGLANQVEISRISTIKTLPETMEQTLQLIRLPRYSLNTTWLRTHFKETCHLEEWTTLRGNNIKPNSTFTSADCPKPTLGPRARLYGRILFVVRT